MNKMDESEDAQGEDEHFEGEGHGEGGGLSFASHKLSVSWLPNMRCSTLIEASVPTVSPAKGQV